jgi:CysZ protein
MGDVMLAWRAPSPTCDGKVWLYVLTPALFSLLLSIGLAIWALGAVVQQMMDYPPMTLLVGWGLVWLAHLLAYLGGWMAIFAVAYLTASLLAAIVIMPLMLKHLSATEYRDVAAMGKDSFVAAAANSVLASGLFVVGWVVTIPLWLIPGFSLLMPLLLMAWLNRRTFAYDALSMHATAERVAGHPQGQQNAAVHARPDHGPARPHPVRRPAGAGAGRAIIRPLRAGSPAPLARRRRGHHRGRTRMSRTFGAIIIGDEILSGKRQDKHFARIAEMLGAARPAPELGRIPGRRPRAPGGHLRRTMAAGDVVFSCGGIGNTPDDHTRQAVAAALGVGLELHPEGLRGTEDPLRRRGNDRPAPAAGHLPGRRQDDSQPVQPHSPASWPTSTISCRASRRWRIR